MLSAEEQANTCNGLNCKNFQTRSTCGVAKSAGQRGESEIIRKVGGIVD